MKKSVLLSSILLSSVLPSSSSYKIISNIYRYNYFLPVQHKYYDAYNTYDEKIRLYSTTNSIDDNDIIMYQRECTTSENIEELGKEIAKLLTVGDVILLRGDLGAGKTTFTRGLLRELYEDDSMIVTSPSYLLDNTYEYNGVLIHHMDLYRLPTASDLSMLGIPNIYDKCVSIIEWPQRLHANDYPSNYLDIEMLINNSNQNRIINIKAIGKCWNEKMKEIITP